jgi:hypothetical protein
MAPLLSGVVDGFAVRRNRETGSAHRRAIDLGSVNVVQRVEELWSFLWADLWKSGSRLRRAGPIH